MPPNEAASAAAAAAAEKEPAAAAADKEALTEDADAAKVKFISSNQETKVEIGDDAKAKDPYPALTKAELMQYANDPTWVRLRWFLFILFWVAWVAMLVASVVIIVVAPKCYTPAPKQWWQKGPVYEVYVKSFKDSDGDGVGDLKGVESKLDYIDSLGVSSVWLSPIYASPMKDNGYDVSDFKAIDPVFGSLEDFKSLAAGLKERGIKLIMDFVPNHTSEQHSWFQKSINKEEPYTDYYVWKTGSRRQTPNNWQSVFGGSAWEFNTARNEWYLHQFYKEQPDLNLRNPAVVAELQDALRFWMGLGVDGFRMDAVAHMFEDADFADEGVGSGSGYESVDHKHTYDLPEVLELLKTFRETIDEGVEGEDEREDPRVMLTEAYLPTDALVKYYGTNFTEHSGDISHMPLNFKLIEEFKNKGDATAEKMHSVLSSYINALPSEAWPNNNMGNHDNSRIASRVGSDLTDAMNMILMLLPGTPIVYYGEELGMTDYAAMPGKKDDRDPERTPMQWSADATAGFGSSATPWLPVNPSYTDVNVAAQEDDARSHLNVFRALAAMRDQKSILFGDTAFRVLGDNVLAFTRVRKGNPGYLVAVNFGDAAATVDVTGMRYMSATGTVHVRSFDAAESEVEAEADGEDVGKYVSFDALPLRPKEGVVVTFVPQMSNEGDENKPAVEEEKKEK